MTLEAVRPLPNPSPDGVRTAIRALLIAIGEDPDREGLQDTPDRVARSWGELFSGYAQDPADILSTTFGEVEGYDEMVLLKGIPFHSTCEAHLLPFAGTAHVAYLPADRVVGLSKLARLVDCFARRLQAPERLTREVATTLMTHLTPSGCAVVMEAHLCPTCHGDSPDMRVVTRAILGEMNTPERRAELGLLIGG